MYRPLRQASNLSLSIVLKTTADPRAGRDGARRAKCAAPIRISRPTASGRWTSWSPPRRRRGGSRRSCSAGFAVLALVLAAIGIYGVMAFMVGQRTREIGIRMALGAQPGVGGGPRAAPGAGAGRRRRRRRRDRRADHEPAADAMLFEVQPSDPVTYGGIALVLAGTAVLAAWWPARRAAAVDPVVALRSE